MSSVHAEPTTNVDVPAVPAQPNAQPNAQPKAQHAAEPPAYEPAYEPAHEPAVSPAHQSAPFRLHTAEHEPPSARRVFTLTLWAAISIFIGLIPAGRLVAGVAFQSFIFPWYPLSTAAIGILGLVLITSAFASIHRARLPWHLMTIATFLLTVNVAMVYAVPF